MNWIKQGVLFCPQNNYGWMVSHAANPVAEPLGEGRFRVYFSTRDKDNRSSIGFFEFDIHDPMQSLYVGTDPLLSPGEPGFFDDSGASIGCLVQAGGRRYLYYTGWNLSVTVPWRNSIGLAISDDGLTFKKYARAPIIDRSDVDPFSVSYPWVMQDGPVWKMWYGSNLSWGAKHSDMAHVIKYAESSDGIHWDRNGQVAIPLVGPAEWGISKPCVIKEAGIYKMWYSYRGAEYRIGYAESHNGMHWQRLDADVGIDVSGAGWDSRSIEYANVFDHDGRRYMLYNGDGYGKTGIGLAVLAEPHKTD
jgi:predicted GH43/DUF377 family glycosyl hydrolase